MAPGVLRPSRLFLLCPFCPSRYCGFGEQRPFLEGVQWSWAVASGPVCVPPGLWLAITAAICSEPFPPPGIPERSEKQCCCSGRSILLLSTGLGERLGLALVWGLSEDLSPIPGIPPIAAACLRGARGPVSHPRATSLRQVTETVSQG